jgi:hypothetical protein
MKKNRWMIGVSTRQGTTNLVPFFQFSGDRLILLETDRAGKEGWSVGPERVIKKRNKEKRNKECMIVSIHSGSDLVDLEEIITKQVETVPENTDLWWIIGGGQKLQQLALSNYFTRRLDQGHDDMACYTEPQEQATYIIEPRDPNDKKRLKSSRQATDCFMEMDEILSIFGYTSKKKTCLWQRAKEDSCEIYGKEHLLTPEQDKWFDDFHKRQDMFQYILDKKEKNPSLPKPGNFFPINFTDSDISEDRELGKYFERLVQTRITQTVAEHPGQHRINQVWGNVHVYKHGGNIEIAEYDVLLVTNFGTIIPIDAKSYDFKKRDEDARLHNLDKLSGAYTDFWSVFPYYQADFSQDSIVQKNNLWKKLLHNPFSLKERNSKMLCVSEPGNTVFHIQKTRKNKICIVDPKEVHKNKDFLKIKTISTLLETLKLEK